MATITRELLQELVDRLRESKEELVPLREEAANVSQLVGDAAGAIERSVKQGNLEAAEEMISGLWQSLGNSPVILAAISGSEESSTAPRPYATRGYDLAAMPEPGKPVSLVRTAEMVIFLQKLIKGIDRSLRG